MEPLVNSSQEGASKPSPTEDKKAFRLLIIEGVIILITVPTVLVALNYFNILSLSKIFPGALDFLPVQKNALNKDITNNIVSQKADTEQGMRNAVALSKDEIEDRLGYKILWMKEGDIEGRTILYVGNNIGKFNGIGEIKDDSQNLSYIVGIFETFKEVEGSNNPYIVLKNPLNSDVFDIQVSLSFPNTRVFIEDLTYLSNEVQAQGFQAPKYYRLLTEVINEKLIIKGDAIVVVTDKTKKTNIATMLIVRRFDGENIAN